MDGDNERTHTCTQIHHFFFVQRVLHSLFFLPLSLLSLSCCSVRPVGSPLGRRTGRSNSMTVICWNGRLVGLTSPFKRCREGPERRTFGTAINDVTHVGWSFPFFCQDSCLNWVVYTGIFNSFMHENKQEIHTRMHD